MDINSKELKNFIDTEAMVFAQKTEASYAYRIEASLSGSINVKEYRNGEYRRYHYSGTDIEKAVEIFNQL